MNETQHKSLIIITAGFTNPAMQPCRVRCAYLLGINGTHNVRYALSKTLRNLADIPVISQPLRVKMDKPETLSLQIAHNFFQMLVGDRTVIVESQDAGIRLVPCRQNRLGLFHHVINRQKRIGVAYRFPHDDLIS